ncbi:unnamed protein product [Linum tenue]|uniref:Uncharacterized protein n=1 Tax=Linum tenue TaxID=586396 RepID=A0AAV0PKK4_9ROSI|nr:unnamed protein product [Linum tenue]
MAACPSSIRLSQALDFHRDVTISRAWRPNPTIRPRFRTSAFPSVKNQKLGIVMSMSGPDDPTHSSGVAEVIGKEVGTDFGSGKANGLLDSGSELKTDGGSGGNGSFSGGGGAGTGGGGGGGSGDEGEKGEEEDDQFGPLMKFEEVIKETEARGATLPSDMLEAAKTEGIRKLLLFRYLELQGAGGILGFLMESCAILRNRMLADPSFLFKIGTEIVIDTCCATFAEVQKRGKDFWAEFELYVADMLVGVVYGAVGFSCGIVGQGIANLIMTAKRSIKKSEEDVPVPPLVKSAALWGVFMAVSSNTRYQVVNGLECLVEASPLAKRIPPVAMAFTVGVRFANNVYGGMQFVDWARWSGVQ